MNTKCLAKCRAERTQELYEMSGENVIDYTENTDLSPIKAFAFSRIFL